MRVLLTNDDGFYAPGLQVLKSVVLKCFSEVYVSAPLENCSGMSKSINVDCPIELQEIRKHEFAVRGTPVDSVLLGLHRMRNTLGIEPDLVLSGINHGSNVGSKVLYSGTVAAASAAASMGIPSIAISQQYSKRTEMDWSNSEKVAMELVQQLLADIRWNRKTVMSINIPHAEILGVKFAEQGTYCPCGLIEEVVGSGESCTTYVICDVNREEPLERYQKESSKLLGEGYVVITPVGSDMTDHGTLNLFFES